MGKKAKKELKEEEKKDLKRTKTDEYYDEFTKENMIIEDLEEKEVVKEETIEVKKEDKEEKTKPKITKNQFIILNIQFIFSIITLVLAVVYFFQKRVMFALQISLGLTMIITGVNNLKVYKRKGFSILYFLLGIVLFVLAVLNILGV